MDKKELVPAKLFIKHFIRPKYIAVTDESLDEHRGVIAELPVFPIEKGIAGSGLLAQVMVDNFVDHLPVYRQIERFKREEVKLSSSTLNGWQESICNLLEPLYDTLKHRVLSQGYLQVDETPIPVLDKHIKARRTGVTTGSITVRLKKRCCLITIPEGPGRGRQNC